MEIGLYTFADMSPDPATGRITVFEFRMKIVLIEMLKAQFDAIIFTKFCIKFIQDKFYFFFNYFITLFQV